MAELGTSSIVQKIWLVATAVLGVSGALVGASAPTAFAATYTVTTTNDTGAGSLRAAVTSANGSAGQDTIVFNLPNPSRISLANTIRITDDLRIEGPGQAALTLTNPNTSVFLVVTSSLYVDSLSIDDVGSSATTPRTALMFDSSGSLTLDDVTISNATNHGVNVARAASVTITNSNFTSNFGDGIVAGAVVGNVLVQNSALSDNEDNFVAAMVGGVITLTNVVSTVASDEAADFVDVGDIVIRSSRFDLNGEQVDINGASGSVSISDSTFSRNGADDVVEISDIAGPVVIERSTFFGAANAALEIAGAVTPTNVTVRNSTLSGNGSSGFLVRAGATLRSEYNTVVRNANRGFALTGGDATATHTIVVENVRGAVSRSAGSAFSADYSLFPTSQGEPGTGNKTTSDAMLGALTNNGGPTFTHLPIAGSPAIGGGNTAVASPPPTDQRGEARVVNVIDIGSVEVGAVPPVSNRGSISISPASRTVAESAGTVSFSLTRSGGSDGGVSVQVATQNGTAAAPGDYVSLSQVVTFADGESGSKSVDVTVVDDNRPESSESLSLELSNATGGVALGATNATLTITDNDAAVGSSGTISIAPATVSVAETAGSVPFSITRSGGSDGSVSVRVVTRSASAQAGMDFRAISQVLSFANGESGSKTVTLSILDDSVNEPTETLTVELAGTTGGAGVGASTSIVTITDDDPIVTPEPGAELDAAGQFMALPPQRLFDTRPGEAANGPKGKLGAEQTIDVQITGVAGVPTNATAVVMNLTMADSEGPGFVTAWASGSSRPDTSNLNYVAAGQFRPNLVTVPIGVDGKVSLYALSPAHLLGDVAGYYVDADVPVAGGRLVPLSPSRLFDTRPTEPGDGPKGLIPANSTIDVQVLGKAGVPNGGVSAVVMNLTATDSADLGFVSVYPTDQQRPTASVLNMSRPGQTVPNLVIVPVGSDGKLRFYTLNGTHLLGDVTGYFTDATAVPDTSGLFVPLAPNRVFDTRSNGAPGPKGFLAGNSQVDVTVAGVGQIPGDAGAVVLNITATEAANLGFVTGYPAGQARPVASLLNLAGPGDTRPNAAILPVGANQKVTLYTLNGTHLLADSFGYYLGA